MQLPPQSIGHLDTSDTYFHCKTPTLFSGGYIGAKCPMCPKVSEIVQKSIKPGEINNIKSFGDIGVRNKKKAGVFQSHSTWCGSRVAAPPHVDAGRSTAGRAVGVAVDSRRLPDDRRNAPAPATKTGRNGPAWDKVSAVAQADTPGFCGENVGFWPMAGAGVAGSVAKRAQFATTMGGGK